jgi:hypothetical protein
MIGTVTFVPEFDIKILVEQPPPQKHRLAGEIGVRLVESATDTDPRVTADLPTLGLAREGAEPLPAAQSRTPSVGKFFSQSSIRECASARCCWALYWAM